MMIIAIKHHEKLKKLRTLRKIKGKKAVLVFASSAQRRSKN